MLDLLTLSLNFGSLGPYLSLDLFVNGNVLVGAMSL